MATNKDEGIADEVVDQLLAGREPSPETLKRFSAINCLYLVAERPNSP